MDEFTSTNDTPITTPGRTQPALPKKRGRPRKAGPALGKVIGSSRDQCIDLERLMATRLFIQAASGGGKSYALRRLLEQTHGKVQQIVIDPEGELVTLAERFPFLVLSPESEEAPLRVHNGQQVAEALHRSGHSAILCLDGFEVEDMQAFVGGFLRGLINMPKDEWHHALIVVDEGQLFAPQFEKSEAKRGMLDLAARGRKRGLCPVVATQRISQLSKGVCANLDNKLVGLTTLENDVERAAEQLGMKVQRAADVLRSLDPGEFFAYGPAITYDVTKVKIGAVATRHGSLSKFTGKAPRKRMTKARLLSTLQDLARCTPEPQSPEAQKSAISVMRRWVIAPLLEKGAGRGSAATRARELDLDAQEVGKWLKAFKKRFATEDLEPKRVWQAMLSDLDRLRPMVQGAPVVILGR